MDSSGFPEDELLVPKWLEKYDFSAIKNKNIKPSQDWSDFEILFSKVTKLEQSELKDVAHGVFAGVEGLYEHTPSVPWNSLKSATRQTIVQGIARSVSEYMLEKGVRWMEVSKSWVSDSIDIYAKVLLTKCRRERNSRQHQKGKAPKHEEMEDAPLKGSNPQAQMEDSSLEGNAANPRLDFPEELNDQVLFLHQEQNLNLDHLHSIPVKAQIWSGYETLFSKVTSMEMPALERISFPIFEGEIESNADKEKARVPWSKLGLHQRTQLCTAIYNAVMEHMDVVEVDWAEFSGQWVENFMEVYCKVLLSKYYHYTSKRPQTKSKGMEQTKNIDPKIESNDAEIAAKQATDLRDSDDESPRNVLEEAHDGAGERVEFSRPKESGDDRRSLLEILNIKQRADSKAEGSARKPPMSQKSATDPVSTPSATFASKLEEADRRIVDQMLKVEEIRLRKFELEREALIKDADRKRKVSLSSDLAKENEINASLIKRNRLDDF